MKARPLVYIITGADVSLHAVTGGPEDSSRSGSDERESGSYALFKCFCHSIIVVLVRLVSKTTIQVV